LLRRIDTFMNLADKIGRENVIWRFDPVVLTDIQQVDKTVERIENLAKNLKNSTNKLVFSFVDTNYRKVKLKFEKEHIELPDLTLENKILFAQKLSNKVKNYLPEIATCAEPADLSKFGINHNKCIDDQLIIDNFQHNKPLMDFVNGLRASTNLKDKGQREFCGCIPSKDIGRYNSCGYSCLYCYAMRGSQPNVSANIFD